MQSTGFRFRFSLDRPPRIRDDQSINHDRTTSSALRMIAHDKHRSVYYRLNHTFTTFLRALGAAVRAKSPPPPSTGSPLSRLFSSLVNKGMAAWSAQISRQDLGSAAPGQAAAARSSVASMFVVVPSKASQSPVFWARSIVLLKTIAMPRVGRNARPASGKTVSPCSSGGTSSKYSRIVAIRAAAPRSKEDGGTHNPPRRHLADDGTSKCGTKKSPSPYEFI